MQITELRKEDREDYKKLTGLCLQDLGEIKDGMYNLGLHLREIKTRELYCFEFNRFEEFIEKRLDIHPNTAHMAIRIAENFTLKDFKAWGFKKLDFILRKLPEEEDRKDFLKSAQPVVETRLPEVITEFKLNKGIEDLNSDISRFKEQSGKIRGITQEEQILGLKRQYSVIKQHFLEYQNIKKGYENKLNNLKANLDEEIENWKNTAKDIDNEEISNFYTLLISSKDTTKYC